MPLIVEDGSGVMDANSYSGVADAKAFAELRGVTLTQPDSTLIAYLVRGTEYLQDFDYQGVKRFAGMRYLKWPRVDVIFDDEAFSANEIPIAIVNALAQLVIEQANGIKLLSTSIGGKAVKRRKTDVLETEYFESTSQRNGSADMPAVRAYLRPLLRTSNFGMLTVVRA